MARDVGERARCEQVERADRWPRRPCWGRGRAREAALCLPEPVRGLRGHSFSPCRCLGNLGEDAGESHSVCVRRTLNLEVLFGGTGHLGLREARGRGMDVVFVRGQRHGRGWVGGDTNRVSQLWWMEVAVGLDNTERPGW